LTKIQEHTEKDPILNHNGGMIAFGPSDGYLLALRRFAGSGLGIAYLLSYFVRDQIDSGQFVSLLRDFTIEPLPICITYPSRELLTPARRALIDHLMARAQTDSFV
jgi:DNA-binding transcriptional LysR family regulator